MIISGGYNIAPFEVEEALYLHPAVQEAAVVGESDLEWGSVVVAYVALRTPVSGREIADFLKPHLGFKRPSEFTSFRDAKNSKRQDPEIRRSSRNWRQAGIPDPRRERIWCERLQSWCRRSISAT